ncbi:adenylate/guanylate cyclase domain-containing protein [Salinimonas sp. HHU 13199]|uniref:Adenylate/guanylate cyclase domain-containing protein n=1 Tax=Salinimonas profundi TaxID=2729140 RepID=A0ABR8LDE1_9ALTE|nr:adenylate/guanylate cyclase domain-containing protein [Salinimonas profundi]MBD3584326.1 adenylate/guanylate cyclase domain-containing protein [Salinimonas profundi]
MNLQIQSTLFARQLKASLRNHQHYIVAASVLTLMLLIVNAPLSFIMPWLALIWLCVISGSIIHRRYFGSPDTPLSARKMTGPTEYPQITMAAPHVSVCQPQRLFLHNATVIFADLAGYKKLCRQLGDAVTVNLLDALFWQLDTQCLHYGIQKIKTTGDGYLAVSGIDSSCESLSFANQSDRRHVRNSIDFAHAILSVTESLAIQYELVLQLRIGIATGPIIVDSLGRFNKHLDVWGNTVNCAACLEQATIPGTISVCPVTRRLMSEIS